MDDEIEEIKQKLMSYKPEDLEFNEPHFTDRLVSRRENKEDVVQLILNPGQLVYVKKEIGLYGDTKYSLYFELEPYRTLILPVIFDRNRRKSLYIITYILRHRSWRNMVNEK
ncbi:MAG TPA: hypothetical protein VJG90_06785 [Candidatus Nanoarchaeia archaeon]|nr:hypothetical protein [Candidatus Nanoarchaeia archaeon]